jgi:hypothetical protein
VFVTHWLKVNMTLVEKKVLREKKSYLNMVIRLRKNFRRFYYKRFLRSKIKKFNIFLAHRKKVTPQTSKKVQISRIGKRRVRKLKRNKTKRRSYLSKFYRISLIKDLYRRGYKKRYFFYYLRSTIDSIRIKKVLSKYKRYNKRRL